MSDTESFIDEVNEELQRDKLFATFKKYGWIAGLFIVLAVGGATYNEWRKAKETATAQELGDAIIQALALEDPEQRGAALDGVSSDNPATRSVLNMLRAAELTAADDRAGALALLDQIAANPETQMIYRDLARLKAAILRGSEQDKDDRLAVFDQLSVPGNPFRTIALEQKALVYVETGDKDEAIALLLQILNEPDVTQDLLQRTQQVIVALGGELPETGLPQGNDG